MKSTSIPVSGDRVYVQGVKTLAASMGITVAELVRRAMDATYGAELERIRGIFFASGDASEHQRGAGTSKVQK